MNDEVMVTFHSIFLSNSDQMLIFSYPLFSLSLLVRRESDGERQTCIFSSRLVFFLFSRIFFLSNTECGSLQLLLTIHFD